MIFSRNVPKASLQFFQLRYVPCKRHPQCNIPSFMLWISGEFHTTFSIEVKSRINNPSSWNLNSCTFCVMCIGDIDVHTFDIAGGPLKPEVYQSGIIQEAYRL